MNTREKGTGYEQFVRNVYQVLLSAEQFGVDKNISIEIHKKMKDKNGLSRDIDVYWEYVFMGEMYKTAVECKNYETAISVDKIEAFITKIHSVGVNKGIFISKSGFQSGAIATGKANNISLLVVREQKDSDWDGYIKTIALNITAIVPPRITSIIPKVNKEWATTNAPYLMTPTTITLSTVDTINISKDETVTLQKLVDEDSKDKGYGKYSLYREFENALYTFGDKTLVIDSIRIDYTTHKPVQQQSTIDFSKYILAMIEYIGEERKAAILHDGRKKEFESPS